MKKQKKGSLLVVDDVEINRMILREILEDEYDIFEAEDGTDALNQLFSGAVSPIAVLLDIMMPGMDGHEVLKTMKSDPLTYDIPVIFITAADAKANEVKGLREGAVEYIEKPFDPDVVKLRVSNQVELRLYRTQLENQVQTKVAEMLELRDRILISMASMIEYRNLESGQHVKRTSILTGLLVRHLLTKKAFFQELMDSGYETIIKAVPLHDIGKIGIPDMVLLKPGRLTPEEFEIIKTHSSIGSNIIDGLLLTDDELYLRHCRDICRHHHERWDGTGYPDALAGRDIPLSARIVSVVDVYDALTSPRVYKPPFSHEDAMDILAKSAGTQFDPDIAAALAEISQEFKDADKLLHEE